MTKMKDDYKIEDIINIQEKNSNDKNIDLIKKSYDYTKDYLSSSEDKEVLNVSYLLISVNADTETIAASILCHLFIDDRLKRSDIEKDFDFNIVKLEW